MDPIPPPFSPSSPGHRNFATEPAGVYKGRKRLLTPDRAAELGRRLDLGESKAALAREFGLDRTTIYRYIGRAAVKSASRVRAGK